MSVFDPAIEEYLFPKEWIQGNVNAMGLIYDDLLEEGLEFSEYPTVVWEDWLDEYMDFAEDFTPSHEPWCHLEDAFSLEEALGVPLRVAQSNLKIVHDPPVTPINVYWMGIDVLTGVDVFYEEVSSGCHFTELTYPAKMYPCYCYETFGVAMENVPENKIYACWKELNMGTSDMVNMRHDLEREYYFNNVAQDRIFTYDKYTVGWPHDLEDGCNLTDRADRAFGKIIKDHLFFQARLHEDWTGQEELEDRVFLWDRASQLRGWTLAIDEDLTAEDVTNVYLELLLQDMLRAGEMVKGEGIFSLLAKDQVEAAEKMIAGFDLRVEDELQAEDDLFRTWLGQALLEEQATMSMTAEPEKEFSEHVNLTVNFSESMN